MDMNMYQFIMTEICKFILGNRLCPKPIFVANNVLEFHLNLPNGDFIVRAKEDSLGDIVLYCSQKVDEDKWVIDDKSFNVTRPPSESQTLSMCSTMLKQLLYIHRSESQLPLYKTHKRGRPIGPDYPHVPNKEESKEMRKLRALTGLSKDEIREHAEYRKRLSEASKRSNPGRRRSMI